MAERNVVAADGVIGPRTIEALRRRNAEDVAAEIMAQRAFQMTGFATWSTHGLGWTRRAIKLAMQAARR